MQQTDFFIIFAPHYSKVKTDSIISKHALKYKSTKTFLYMDSQQLTAAIKDQLQSNINTDVSLINIDENNVTGLSVPVVLNSSLSSISSDASIGYEAWRQKCLSQLTYSYDRKRFERSTLRSTLKRKVLEHIQYSFIVRTQDKEGFDRVFKYIFQRLDDEANQILCTFKEVSTTMEHDILTGGLSRVGLLRELTNKFHSLPESMELVLLYFDIRDFRLINERHGSDIGDRVLQHMYTSMVYSDLHPKSYARTDSDKFVCLIDKTDLQYSLIESLCHQEYTIDKLTIPYQCVCGIFHITDRSISPAVACNRAQLATTFIREQHVIPWIVFEESMQRNSISDTEIINQIDEAIENNEFIPYFQPIVNVQTGRIEMAEALVRWKSATRGMIPPGVFIPVLERHGGLSRIDSIMEKNIFELQQYRHKKGLPMVPIDINLSWVDFADADLMMQIKTHFSCGKMPSHMMCIEITESTLSEFAENRQDILEDLKKHDARLLIDDFGQAYSFGTMRDVDFYIIKLDKSLIDQIGDSRKADLLVESLISMFHKMGAKIIAEGVETASQAEYLKMIGCDYIQGYFYYRPMDQESFLTLLDRQAAQIATEENNIKEETKKKKQTEWVEREVLENQFEQLQQTVEAANCLRMLLEEQGIHYFEWDPATHIDVGSEKFCRMYNMTDFAIPNMPEQCDLCLPEDRDRFRKFYYRAEQGELYGTDYFRLYNPDGKSFSWYRKTFYTLFNASHKPYKVIMTMQNCSERFQYNAMLERNALLTRQQDIITFMYTLADDTLSFSMCDEKGKISNITKKNYINTPIEEMSGSQRDLVDVIRYHIDSEKAPKTGFYDFYEQRTQNEMRAHYAHVYGEYGTLYAIVGQAESINKTRERLQATIRSQKELLHITNSLQKIYNAFTYVDLVQGNSRILVLDERYTSKQMSTHMDWETIANAYAKNTLKPQYVESWHKFMDLKTVNERLKGKKFLVMEYEDDSIGWIRGFLVPATYGNDGNLSSLIFVSQPVGEEKSTMERLIHLSEFDSLTQIRNRFSGEQRIEKILEDHRPGVFGILDCDKFKEVNDTYGHTVGDEVLIAMAKGMTMMNPDGINFRLGGDEFAFFIEGEHKDEEIKKHIDILFDYIDNLRIERMHGQKITVSIGACYTCGKKDCTFDDIYRKADTLLYESKRFSGNKITM